MESEWHQNVWMYGLGATGATVAASVLGDPTLVLTNSLTYEGEWLAQIWSIPTTVGSVDPYGSAGLPTHGLHFPYGYPLT